MLVKQSKVAQFIPQIHLNFEQENTGLLQLPSFDQL